MHVQSIDTVHYLCNDNGVLGFHDLHIVGFFLIVPSPLNTVIRNK